MPITADERITRVEAKIERAKQHLDELSAAIQSFLQAGPCQIGAKRDAQTREVHYYAVAVTDVPLRLSAIAADVLHNLRSALNHLACELVMAGNNYPTRNTGFPIFGSAAIYRAQAASKVRGMRSDAIEAIGAIKPYKGGNDILWYLQALAGIDKHRLLRLGSLAYRFQDVTPSVHAYLRKVWSTRAGNWPSPEMPDAAGAIEYERRLVGLKAGDVIFTDVPDADVNSHLAITFDIALAESKIANGLPLGDTMKKMLTVVENVVGACKPLLV